MTSLDPWIEIRRFGTGEFRYYALAGGKLLGQGTGRILAECVLGGMEVLGIPRCPVTFEYHATPRLSTRTILGGDRERGWPDRVAGALIFGSYRQRENLLDLHAAAD